MYAYFSLQDLSMEIGLLGILVVLLVIFVLHWKPTKLPPGPSVTLPILGNVLQFIGQDPRIVLSRMREKYGDVVCFSSIGNEPIVILNGYDTIKEALVHNSRVFSQRPETYFTKLFQSKGLGGTVWHEVRAFFTNCLNQDKEYLEEKILKEVSFFSGVLDSNSGRELDLTKYLPKVTFNITTDILTSTRYDYNDPKLQSYLDDIEALLQFTGTIMLLNSYPVLKYLPGDLLRLKLLDDNFARRYSFVSEIYERRLKNIDERHPRDLMDHFILEIQNREGEDSVFTKEELISNLQIMHIAGTGTTSSTLGWAIWFLKENLCVQKKFQQEIIAVLGQQGIPSLKKRSKMPYVEATIMEVMRIAFVSPFGAPHTVSEDVVFRGYHIPKSTQVIINMQSIFADLSTPENLTEFRPERFLDENGALVKPKEFIPFGIGKRMCLGEGLARAKLFLLLTSMYQSFSFVGLEDETVHSNAGIIGVTYHPKPFEVRILRGQLEQYQIKEDS